MSGGAYVRELLAASMSEVEFHEQPGSAVALFSTPSPERDDDNQDAAAVVLGPDGDGVLAVADGVGGQRGGAKASQAAISELVRCVRNPDAGPTRAAILDGFELANRAVAALGVGAGTTLAAVEITSGVLRPYHVGDSQILVVGQRGRLRLVTIAHSPVGHALASGLLDESEAMHHEDRHYVTNLLGYENMRIELGAKIRLAKRDTVLLASDGLFDNLAVDEIVEIVRSGPLDRAAAELLRACRARIHEPEPDAPSKPDDLTFLIWRSA